MITDLKLAIRQLLKRPSFTAVAVLILALGIGANAAMFSLLNQLLLRPLPVSKPEQLVGCYGRSQEPDGGYRPFSYPNYLDLREGNSGFSGLLAHNLTMAGLTEGELTRRVFTSIVSANYFETFDARVTLGREFTVEEEKPGSAIPVCIVSHEFWQQKGDGREILGETLRLNGELVTVVGVAPKGFTGSSILAAPGIWVPLGMYERIISDYQNSTAQSINDRNHHVLLVAGRLKDGVSREAAEEDLKGLAGQLAETYPAENENYTVQLTALPRISVGSSPSDAPVTPLAALLMGASAVVLLIACLNLANMLLARGTVRRKETAVRLALGSGRFRIVRQLLTEGLVLALAGGLVGLFFAQWATQILYASINKLTDVLTVNANPMPDLRVIAITFGFCLLSVLLAGLGPAWKISRTDVAPELKDQGGEHPVGGYRWYAPRNLLVIGQIAFSLALLTAAGLFFRGAQNAAQANPGFALEQGLLVEVDPSLAGYDETRGRKVFALLQEELSSLPGVESVSMASMVPYGPFGDGKSVFPAGVSRQETPSQNSEPQGVNANYTIVQAGYFKTLGLPLLRGRDFTRLEADSTQAAPVAIISKELAHELWPDEDALGQRIHFGLPPDGQDAVTMEVVGMVPGVKHNLFASEPRPRVYVPLGQQYQGLMNVHVRLSRGGSDVESSMLQTVRQRIRVLDDQLPVLSLKTLTQHRDSSMGVWIVQLGSNLFATFGLLALLLSLVGVYGVRAYVVSRRTREIGIRMALGASPGQVVRSFLKESLRVIAIGMALGLFLAFAMGQLVSGRLYQVSGSDPFTFVTASVLLVVTALLATYLPTRRAARISPMTALRYE